VTEQKSGNSEETMNMIHAKPLIPNKEWIVENNGQKLGTLSKEKKGYVFLSKGIKVQFNDLQQFEKEMDLVLEPVTAKKISKTKDVYGYETKTIPHNPLYDVKRKLPIYTKSAKSISKHCAGHYIIRFPKGWVKSHCPKLITLERYPYRGPFHTEQESREELSKAHRERD
jgi:uncharacterized protein (DUF952 family)